MDSNKVLEVISSNVNGMSARYVAKGLGFKSAKEINPFLYKMLSAGFVEKMDSLPPIWRKKGSSPRSVMEYGNNFVVIKPQTENLTLNKTPMETFDIKTKNENLNTLPLPFDGALKSSDLKTPEVKEKILKFLNDSKIPCDARSVAKGVIGEKGLAKDVNPALYSLQKEKLVNRTADKIPLWSALSISPSMSPSLNPSVTK